MVNIGLKIRFCTLRMENWIFGKMGRFMKKWNDSLFKRVQRLKEDVEKT